MTFYRVTLQVKTALLLKFPVISDEELHASYLGTFSLLELKIKAFLVFFCRYRIALRGHQFAIKNSRQL